MVNVQSSDQSLCVVLHGCKLGVEGWDKAQSFLEYILFICGEVVVRKVGDGFLL